MSTSDMSCHHCNSEKFNTQYISLPNRGFHIKATCASCGRFIKFISHDLPRFHFGKYSGQTVVEVTSKDPGYLRWCLSNDIIRNTRLKDAVEWEVVTA